MKDSTARPAPSVSFLVNVVLDELLSLTQIDPSCISPDDSLKDSLHMSSKEISDLFERSADRLGLRPHLNQGQSVDQLAKSPRELVDLLGKIAAANSSKAS